MVEGHPSRDGASATISINTAAEAASVAVIVYADCRLFLGEQTTSTAVWVSADVGRCTST